MYQNGACGTGYSGASNFLFTDGGTKVVARVEMVESVRGRDAEDEVCPSDINKWSFPVETGHIFQNRAIAAFGDRNRTEGGHLLQASP